MKKTIRSIALLVCIMLVLSACGNNGSSSSGTSAGADTSVDSTAAASSGEAAELKPVELSYYAVESNSQPELKAVNEEINKVLTEKINATITINLLDFGSYGQKMNVLMASGTPVDIMWTSNWSEFEYTQNVYKGSFLETEELFKKYAPKSYASLEKYWDTAKVGGKIYGMPNELKWANENGFHVKEDLAVKYGFDFKDKTIKIEDIEPYLAKVKAGEPGITPLLLSTGGLLNCGGAAEVSMNKWDINGWTCTEMGDTSLTVLNSYETPEFKQRLELARKWYELGYINKDAATNKNLSELQSKAFAVYSPTSLNTGLEKMTAYQQPWGGPFFYTAVSPTVMQATASMSSLLCIGKNSANPERAAMFLELTHSDPDFIHLFIYGIEGQHYTSEDGKYIKTIENSGYGLADWVNVNCRYKLLAEGQAEDSIERELAANSAAMLPEFAGFVFDPSNVKTEIANCTSVRDEYLPGLATGTLDPSKILPEFLEKLKAAGIEKIVAETQKQMDAWKAVAGK